MTLTRALFPSSDEGKTWPEEFKDNMRRTIRDYEYRYLMCCKEKGRKKVLAGVRSGLRDGFYFFL